ncbi:DNA polymerase III subunit delta' [Anderseniella sp. Alg231-50]|uniref:DNA polymerase III subunit delta' n=1 Tax=Anderseniella sp. Alg231-50 TaxID=1922226 RepID=UPI000D560DFD
MAAKDDEQTDPRETVLHPRHAQHLIGHRAAEKHLLEAYHSGRFHHGWLITGPQGIGKATLAYRLARYLLRYRDHETAPSDTLSVPDDDIVTAQVSARSHPDLLVLQRDVDKGKLKAGITVDASRKAADFFGKTAGAGGWRIAIVDVADEMNTAAANSILKTLEEPPERSLFILLCHEPGRLLPTIRSRCIELPLHPLSPEDTAAALEQLPDGLGKPAIVHVGTANGRPGLALALAETGAGAIFDRFAKAAESGRLDVKTRMAIANSLHGRGTDDRFNVFCSLLDDWITSAAATAIRASATIGQGQALADCHQTIGHSIRETNALNLDRRLTMLQAFDLIEQARKA